MKLKKNKEDNSKKSEIKKEKKEKSLKFKIILFSIITVIFLLITFVIFYYAYNLKLKDKDVNDIKNELSKVVIKYENTIEYGSSWTYEDFINNLIDKEKLGTTNIKIQVEGKNIETKEEYKFLEVKDIVIKIDLTNVFKYKLIKKYEEKITKTEEVKIKVEDTKMPILEGISDKTITVGDTIDLKSGIKAHDEVDGELEIKIEGEVDNNKAGKYEIKVSCEDKNGNKSEGKFTVTVNEKPKVNTWTSSSKSSGGTTSNSAPNKNTVAGRLALAKEEAKRVVSKIIKPGMSDLEKATAITNYIFETVDVQSNQSLEAYKTNYGNEAYAALIMKIAACSGRCKAVTLLCDAAGLKSQHINANQWQHQWNKILINGKWLVFDSQIGLSGAEKHPLED